MFCEFVLLFICLSFSWVYSEPVVGTTEGDHLVYYEAPSKSSFPTPVGIVLTLHGCNHLAFDFWPQSKSCEYCYGLPVGLTTSQRILERGYVFASISPNGPDRCFSKLHDLFHFQEAVELLDKQFGKLPLFLYGASSGGAFISIAIETWSDEGYLRSKYPVAAMCLHVSAFKHVPDGLVPPTMMVPMEKDSISLTRAKHAVKHLSAKHVDVQFQPLSAIALTPTFFHDHGPTFFSVEDSQKMFELLMKEGHLTGDGHIKKDPRDYLEWEQALMPEFPKISFNRDRSPVKELMNMAYAYHEISDQHLGKMLDFFDKHRGKQ